VAEFTTRLASLDDAHLLADIQRAADQRYLDSPYRDLLSSLAIPDEAAQRYCNEDRIFVAEVDDRVVGYLGWHLEPDPSYLCISQVSVLPEFGQRGIGAALMRSAVDTAVDHGISRLVLATFSDVAWNEPWYRRLGFRTIDPSDWTVWMRDVVDAQHADVPWENRVWMQLDIELLHGGVANAGAVVRAGREVRRPSNPNSPTIHRLLRHLRKAGFDGASEPLGIEPGGRERLVFIEGDVPAAPYPEWAQSDETLASTARLIRGLHDASIGFDETDATWSSELTDRTGADRSHDLVICHNDVCMENIVFRDGETVALLDFDFAAPGRRVHDLAAFARMCIPIDDDEGAGLLGWVPADRPRRLTALADAYGLDADQRAELLECLDATIAGGGKFVLRRVEAGEQAFIDMWNAMGGMARYDARRTYWATNRPLYAQALHQVPGT
jgi:N-acetylglutamate synthase-like GNAT family acetyltransferase